jgi:hypothetical protein
MQKTHNTLPEEIRTQSVESRLAARQAGLAKAA